MSNIEKYSKFFTKDYLMGPNSFRLLDELIRRKPGDVQFHRTLDLGCGYALTSFFIANETEADDEFRELCLQDRFHGGNGTEVEL